MTEKADSPFAVYLDKVESARRFQNATEHTYRGFLQQLFADLTGPEIVAVNEPKRSECGAPDYVLLRAHNHLILGYVEAKDVGISLDETLKTEQLSRYLRSLGNLVLTDYLEFRWFVDGKHRQTFSLADPLPGGKLTRDPACYEQARLILTEFIHQKPADLNNAEELAKRLARLTHLIRDIIVESFQKKKASQTLVEWRAAFAQTLLPELGDEGKEADFADMFAQTLAYGLFSARVMSGSLQKFTRQSAQDLIPKTNKFLRDFFYLITGPELEGEPFALFVEDLVQLLDHTAMQVILEDFGKRRDPIVHFYETFLQAYDPKLRELRGVYYTPEPVVGYIVRSVDWLLREKFSLPDGLADKSKFPYTRAVDGKEVTEESHRVLILDPATGTATFLYAVIGFIRDRFMRKNNAGQWEEYVREHLIPRLFGFELLMASYAIAHFKLGLQLLGRDLEDLFRKQWEYHFGAQERLNIYLTNTLEDLQHVTQQLGPLRILSDEANQADDVKRRKPVLVVLGNPPYSGHSANSGEWIKGLVRDYYQCDGKPLGERNPKWLQDDYVKFLRWAQWRIDQTGQGILAFITNNGYLDNPTFRGMRQQLMKSFDEIYLLDLHGSTKKKERIPGTNDSDKNVFDIQQGVAIGIFVKLPANKLKRKSCRVFHADVWGKRNQKYDWLSAHSVKPKETDWKELKPDKPRYLFKPQDNTLKIEYEHAQKLTEFMTINGWGVATRKDYLLVDVSKKALRARIDSILAGNLTEAYRLGVKESPHWNFSKIKPNLGNTSGNRIHNYLYRPFDVRSIFYEPLMIERGDHRTSIMRHYLGIQTNIGLLISRTGAASGSPVWDVVFITEGLSDLNLFRRGGAFSFPLYINNESESEEELGIRDRERRPNLSKSFCDNFSSHLGLVFIPDGAGDLKKTFGPEDVLHYTYAIFYAPSYRQRYAEFLRLDFPRLPLTENVKLFRKLVATGRELTNLHLLRTDAPHQPNYPRPGTHRVDKVRFLPPGTELPRGEGKVKIGRVHINDDQYFDNVPVEAWEFPIGGYLPAQKWLKDRKDCELSYDEQAHYPRIIAALMETRRLMTKIDMEIEEAGGWPLK